MRGITERCRLAPFRRVHADQIVGWVKDRHELRWLAPSTEPPLTPAKVIHWRKPGGRAYVLIPGSEQGSVPAPELLGYCELNPMQSQPAGWWIGHFVVNPAQRRCGLGRAMLAELLAEAFEGLRASTVCLVVFPDNTPAVRCYAEGGLRLTADEYHQFGRDLQPYRLHRYEISAGQWRTDRIPSRPHAP